MHTANKVLTVICIVDWGWARKADIESIDVRSNADWDGMYLSNSSLNPSSEIETQIYHK